MTMNDTAQSGADTDYSATLFLPETEFPDARRPRRPASPTG